MNNTHALDIIPIHELYMTIGDQIRTSPPSHPYHLRQIHFPVPTTINRPVRDDVFLTILFEKATP